MIKLSDKAIKFILTVFAIISVVATVLVGFVSNSAEVSKEVVAKLEAATRTAPITTQKGSVNVKFVNPEGIELVTGETLTGYVGTEYKAVRKDIANYAPCGAEPFNKAGNFTAETQEVVFVYERDESNVVVSEENNTVTVNTFHARKNKEIDVKIVTKDQSGRIIKGISYTIKDDAEGVLREGKVYSDKFVVGTVTVASTDSETFYIEEDPAPYFQTLVEGPIKLTINKRWDSVNSEYKVEDGDIILENAEGVTYEYNPDENLLLLTITNKDREGGNVFDLDVKKYVKKLVVKEDGNTVKEITGTVEDKDNLIKIDIAKSKLNKTQIEVTYGVVIENVGNIPGSALEVTDYLPDGFKYISGGCWSADGNIYKTTELEDIELEPGDSVELEMKAEWNVAENEIGLRQNKAEITDYYNEPGFDDKTPDNVDTADIMVTIKTGGTEVKVGTILLALNIALITLYVVKKSRKEK